MNKLVVDVLEKLHAIDDSFITGGVSTHFLEFVKSSDEEELQIYGNQAGLIYLAKNILEIANKNMESEHRHFDGAGLIDRCDMEITVTLKKA